MIKQKLTLSLLLALITILTQPLSLEAKDAQELFGNYKETIYQIRVIELTSGNKSTIGSGFQITLEGHIATNYHVISEAVKTPDRYRVEYIQHDGKTGHLKILDVDVVHDLAIMIRSNESTPFLIPSSEPIQKGTKIFSLGNPLDLGMTIVEGTYNGLLEKSLYEKILFSGSLNPGMSGGPAIDRFGRVVGINVSTKGNQLSFLVPVRYLNKLIENVQSSKSKPVKNFNKRIENQVVANQEIYFGKLISDEWEIMTLGKARVPGEVSGIFKCWGETDKNEQNLYSHTYIDCSTDDVIFLNSLFSTGKIQYGYHWYTGKELDRFRFYNMYENAYGNWTGLNFASKEDVSEYNCNSEFLNFSNKEWKGVFCARQYKDYPLLHDIFFNLSLVSENETGFILVLGFSGVTKNVGINFTKKFIESIGWEK